MDKALIKSILYNYEVRIVSRIASGVLNRASKMTLMRQIRHEILHLQLDELEKNEIWKFANAFYRHTIAGTGRWHEPESSENYDAELKKELQKRASRIYTVLKQDVQMLEHQKNFLADSIEFRKKHQEVVQMMSGEDKFFYCTAHKNPACGHQEYQGKIYYRQNQTYSDEELEFISREKLKALEEVVMGPIWLTTRRNCKHRLIPISFLQAQTGDYSNGSRRKDISYEEEQYRTYNDRLKMLISVKKVFAEDDVIPEQLKLDMTRTYKLCRAWSRRIKKSRS